MAARSRLPLHHALGATLACAVLLGVAPSPATRSDLPFVVVVHSRNPSGPMPRAQVARLFLRKLKEWPNGAIAEPVDLALGAPTRDAFTRLVLGKSIATVRAYWQQRLFSGAEVPPPEKATEAEALEFVRTHAAAVGYVSVDTPLPAGVRALELGE